MKKTFLLLIAFTLLGCNKMTPAGFWKNFDPKHIVEGISDQGPWGGHRVIHWRNLTGRYNESDVLKFASHNGWKLVGSKYVHDMGSYDDLSPMWIANGGMLYKFDSKWIKVDADTNKTAYGYLLISSDKTQMSMYHLWGE
jgi:hypothetical protein